jgi:cobalt/nickel transport system permease protein
MTQVLDAVAAPNSFVARRDARWKLAALTLAIVAAAVIRTPPFIASAACGAILLLVLSRFSRSVILSRLVGPGLFLLPFLLLLPLIQGSRGAMTALIVGTRAMTLLILGIVLFTTSPMHRNMQAAQALGMPIVLTQIGLMSYRYLFVLRDEFHRIRIALRVRGFRSGANRRSYRIVGHVGAMLLVRGDERAERVAQAMRCRGFDGRLRSLSPFQTRYADVLFFAIIVAVSVAIVAGDLALRHLGG